MAAESHHTREVCRGRPCVMLDRTGDRGTGDDRAARPDGRASDVQAL